MILKMTFLTKTHGYPQKEEESVTQTRMGLKWM
jgi:hypothetical protein